MKLYDYPLAFNPQKARLIFAEKQLPYEKVVIDLFNGESLNPAFMKINPKSTLPVLIDNGKVITESRQILEYVDGLGGGPLGANSIDRQLVEQWLDKIDAWDGNLYAEANADATAQKIFRTIGKYRIKYAEARQRKNPDLGEVYAEKIAAMKRASQNAADPSKVEANQKQLATLLDDAEKQLTSTKFLAGDAYSVADVIMTPVLKRLGLAKQEEQYLSPRPKLQQYFAELKQRPSHAEVYGKLSTVPILKAVAKAYFSSFTGWY